MKKLKNLSKYEQNDNSEVFDKYEETISKLEASVNKYKTDASQLRTKLQGNDNLVDPEELINKIAQCVCDSLESTSASEEDRLVVSTVAKAVYDLLLEYKKG